MKMNKLAAVIKKIVREEVQKEVRNILTEQKLTPTKDNKHMSLTEALTQTEIEAYPTMKTFNAGDARAGFAAMQDGMGAAPSTLVGHNGQVVSADRVDPSVTKALTRDYSKLVQRFKK
tara:strand:+ start:1137 stop:1490 length:354 start_codon:yes stop_codon:yes gene_type:complete